MTHFGQTAANLFWVARTIVEYGMFVLVVGVWSRDHLLTYYNGDLDGR